MSRDPGDFRATPAHGPAGTPAPDTAALERVLHEATLWGLEIETAFRVLAATFEPVPGRHPWPDTGDARLQLLCFPVSTVLGSLRRSTADGRELLRFEEDQLLDVVTTFDGASVKPPLFGRPEPRPGEWGPQFSLQGRSGAPDGTSRTITISLRRDELTFDLFARFDTLELRGPNGEVLELPGRSEDR